MRVVITEPDVVGKLKKLILENKDKEHSIAILSELESSNKMLDMLTKSNGVEQLQVNPIFTLFKAGNLKITLSKVDHIL